MPTILKGILVVLGSVMVPVIGLGVFFLVMRLLPPQAEKWQDVPGKDSYGPAARQTACEDGDPFADLEVKATDRAEASHL